MRAVAALVMVAVLAGAVPAAGEDELVILQGVVEPGVEMGCWVMWSLPGGWYNLLGDVPPPGVWVVVWGYLPSGVVTICMQGTPFEVIGYEVPPGWWWPPESCSIEPGAATTSDPITITLGGDWPDACIPDSCCTVVSDDAVCVNVFMGDAGSGCPTVVTPWSLSEAVGALPAGAYVVKAAVYDGSALIAGPTPVGSVEVSELPALVWSEPPHDGTLPKIKNNVILLQFDGEIVLPAGPALSVIELIDGTDVSASFTYTLQTIAMPNDTLKAKENGAVLLNCTWYRVTPAAGFDVQAFVRDFCTCVGDADGSGQVLAPDMVPIKLHLFEVTDARYDLDGSGQVLAPDYVFIRNHLFYSCCIFKP